MNLPTLPDIHPSQCGRGGKIWYRRFARAKELGRQKRAARIVSLVLSIASNKPSSNPSTSTSAPTELSLLGAIEKRPNLSSCRRRPSLPLLAKCLAALANTRLHARKKKILALQRPLSRVFPGLVCGWARSVAFTSVIQRLDFNLSSYSISHLDP